MKNLSAKKITMATVKSFIKEQTGTLYINVTSKFDGMVDGCEPVKGGFMKAAATTEHADHTKGVAGAWFVGGSRDYFQYYNDGKFEGIEVSNSCGRFVLAAALVEIPGYPKGSAEHTFEEKKIDTPAEDAESMETLFSIETKSNTYFIDFNRSEGTYFVNKNEKFVCKRSTLGEALENIFEKLGSTRLKTL